MSLQLGKKNTLSNRYKAQKRTNKTPENCIEKISLKSNKKNTLKSLEQRWDRKRHDPKRQNTLYTIDKGLSVNFDDYGAITFLFPIFYLFYLWPVVKNESQMWVLFSPRFSPWFLKTIYVQSLSSVITFFKDFGKCLLFVFVFSSKRRKMFGLKNYFAKREA